MEQHVCSTKVVYANAYLAHLNERQVSMNKIRDIYSSLTDQNENSLCYILLFGKENMNDSENTHILKAAIEHILSTERFDVPLLE